ncbi:MAG: sugar transferase [Phormidium tanganyikae FI6-MK23]|jgi:exopolysaccharide biosynthesis polyprenyl glycosylphosphotransferase|nr:sugar transferase [Phormidium tanganyikae FI6-MK23]
MASQVSPPAESFNRALPPSNTQRARDLRSPVSYQFRQGSVIGWLRILILLALDFSMLFLAWRIAQVSGTDLSVSLHVHERVISFTPTALLTIGIFAVVGLYREGDSWRDSTKLITTLLLVDGAIALTTLVPDPSEAHSLIPFAWFVFLGLVFVLLSRFSIDLAIQGARKIGTVRHPVFIFCQPDQAKRVVPVLGRKPHYTVAGWNDPQQLSDENRAAAIQRLCRLGVSEVFLCAQFPARELMLIYWDLRNAGITLHICVLLSSNICSSNSQVWQLPELYTATFAPPTIAGIEFQVKRGFDFLASVLFLLLTFPVYLAIAILIKLDSPGPIFFRQTRIGLQNRPFSVWKFRTMVINAAELQRELESQNENRDGVLFKMKDDPRVTRVGKFLRRYSLDELPQVFNVLFGEMSFVGPRPLPMRDVEKFSEHDFIRHAVLPGITGMWQVSGRSEIDNFDEVLRLDMVYIKDWSLWLDLKIILQTVRVVLQKTGAY